MDRSQLQRQLECPVCMEQFRTPKQLPCQHTFCQPCLEGIVRNNRGPTVSCPECRRQHRIPSNGIAGFPTSVTIQRLIEAMTQQQSVPESQLQPFAPPQLPVHNAGHSASLPRDNVGNNADLDRYIHEFIEQQEQLERDAVRAPAQRNSRRSPRVQNRTETQRAQENPNTEHRRNGQGGSVNRPTDNSRNSQEGCVISIQCMRRSYRRILGIVFEKKIVNHYIVPFLLVLTFARFIAGAVKINSDCVDESNAATYLFVKAWFGFLLYVNLLVFSLAKRVERALDNLFVQIWLIIHVIFTIIWFSIGTAWVFGNYADMRRDCPKEVEDWNFHFINFAVFLTAVDWIGTVIFVFYLFYHLCDRENDNNAD